MDPNLEMSEALRRLLENYPRWSVLSWAAERHDTIEYALHLRDEGREVIAVVSIAEVDNGTAYDAFLWLYASNLQPTRISVQSGLDELLDEPAVTALFREIVDYWANNGESLLQAEANSMQNPVAAGPDGADRHLEGPNDDVVSPEAAEWFADAFGQLASHIGTALLGKEEAARLTLTCMLSEGHLLLNDVAGIGKSTLARAAAETVQGSWTRILLDALNDPSDVRGVTLYDSKRETWEFHRGPIFNNIVLVENLDLAKAPVRSVLLDAIEDHSVVVDGSRFVLDNFFMVIASSNTGPSGDDASIFDALLDRFMMQLAIGYPDSETMTGLLQQRGRQSRHRELPPLVSANTVVQMSELTANVGLTPGAANFLLKLGESSRSHGQLASGLSVRALLSYARAARTWALAAGRSSATQLDLRELAGPILRHRIHLTEKARLASVTIDDVIADLVELSVTD